jgi:hypothetical protein
MAQTSTSIYARILVLRQHSLATMVLALRSVQRNKLIVASGLVQSCTKVLVTRTRKPFTFYALEAILVYHFEKLYTIQDLKGTIQVLNHS